MGEDRIGVDGEAVWNLFVLRAHRCGQRDVHQHVGGGEDVERVLLAHAEPRVGRMVAERPSIAETDGAELSVEERDAGRARRVVLVADRVVSPRLVAAVLDVPDVVAEVGEAERVGQRVPEEPGERERRDPSRHDDPHHVCRPFTSVDPSAKRRCSWVARKLAPIT